jgi:peptidoglycan hydrolase-like protein with peptidoglycan-binding domain
VKKRVAGWILVAVPVAAVLLAVAFLALWPWHATALGANAPDPSPSPSGSVSPAPSPTDTTSPSPSPSPSPLRFASVTPKNKAGNVAFSSRITVRFSRTLAADTPLPRLKPSVPGSWTVAGSTLWFAPKGHLPVYGKVTVTIPGGAAGVLAANGGRLAATRTVWFTVGGPSSVLRLQQLLAEVGYLPLRFAVPSGTGSGTVPAITREPATLDLVALKPLAGTFAWRYRHIPATLSALWKRGRSTVLVRGAVMSFEADHHLATDGVAGRAVWSDLLRDVARRTVVKRAYRYLEVSTAIPETLRVWSCGRIVYRSLCNTGIAVRPTALGTFPVYARYLSTTMSGTNPDGSHYSDPGIPYVAYFNGGDAVHGFIRGSYGWPQSLGCVELPYGAAAVVYRYDPIGTLVCVS